MHVSLVNAAFRTAQWTLVLTFAATALLVAALVGERVVFERTSHDAAETSRLAAVVAEKITLADERLTMSANMAAATGQQQWVDRYNAFLPDIDKAIAEATRMSTPRAAEAFDKATRVANDNLVELERRAFAAVAENDLPMARSILDSKFYAFQKASLADGTDTFLQSLLSDQIRHVEHVASTARLLLVILILAGTFGFGLLWLVLRTKLRASRNYHRTAEQRLAHMVLHDELTGLANRRYLGDVVRQILADRVVGTNWLGIDLDGFKKVNDTFGHAAGDAVLKAVAERITSTVGSDAFVARVGGDEFVVLLIGDRGHARRVADRIATALSDPIAVQEGVARIGASVGATAICADDTIDEVARRADERMYNMKSVGRRAA